MLCCACWEDLDKIYFIFVWMWWDGGWGWRAWNLYIFLWDSSKFIYLLLESDVNDLSQFIYITRFSFIHRDKSLSLFLSDGKWSNKILLSYILLPSSDEFISILVTVHWVSIQRHFFHSRQIFMGGRKKQFLLHAAGDNKKVQCYHMTAGR